MAVRGPHYGGWGRGGTVAPNHDPFEFKMPVELGFRTMMPPQQVSHSDES